VIDIQPSVEARATVTDDFEAVVEVRLRVPLGNKSRCVVWQARGVHGTTLRSPLDKVTIARAGRRIALWLPAGRQGETLNLHLRFSQRLDLYRPGIQRVRSLPLTALSRLAYLTDPRKATRVPVPWIDEPLFTIHVQCLSKQTVPIGPLYALHPRATDGNPATFSFYGGEPLPGIPIAQLQRIDSDIPLFTLDTAEGVHRELAIEIADSYKKIEGFLKDLFGDPVLRPGGIVLFAGTDVPNHLAGSYVFLNVNEVARYPSPEERKARLVCALAHEVAHLWWSYGIVWTGFPTGRRLDEAIAAFLEWRTVGEIGGPVARRLSQQRNWHWMGKGIGRSLDWLRQPRHSSTAGASVALLLIGWDSARPKCVDQSLDEIWKVAHERPVSPERFAAAIERSVGRIFGEAVTQAAQDPRPFVSSARVEVVDSGLWRLRIRRSHFRQRDFDKRLETLLNALPTCVWSGQWVDIECGTPDKVAEVAEKLLGVLVMFKRDARVLFFYRYRWLSRLWEWSEKTIQTPGLVPPLWCATLLALVMNRDHPNGFVGIAKIFSRLIPHASKPAYRAAGARALYRGEEALRGHLL
jgi:hypothetical protein